MRRAALSFELEVASRLERHKDLLDAAEDFGERALISFERGGAPNIDRANHMAQAIAPAPGGDIGWQIVDVAIMLTRHRDHLLPPTRAHLGQLLEEALPAWSDREFGRGNVNHPVIATWLYAAAGQALEHQGYTDRADQALQRFIHIFSQTGDMSEYNSPTYLGPTLVGLACLGQYAALPSTRLRAQLIEERIWLGLVSRWHAPTQQLAGPHSRAYADSTLGFGGISRYLAHAVLPEPVSWDTKMAQAYDHDHDAEWAAKIAACVFHFPPYLSAIADQKSFPYTIQSDTDGEDYTVDGREVYRGGRGHLTTYLNSSYCLGSSERPYVDAGQTEMCIAYWKLADQVQKFTDMRALYVRYVANERLPGQENMYYAWYGGKSRAYSPNLLHQDGRQHVLQHEGKAILLAQPVKRENGHIYSLRLDALIPLYAPLDEIWLGNQRVVNFPMQGTWDQPVTLRDGDIYVALLPLRPTNLGGAELPVEISIVNHHLIISIYNLRGSEARSFPAYVLDHTHNGFALEIASSNEYAGFEAFQRHITAARLTEQLWQAEARRVSYQSGPDLLEFHYHPSTQETLRRSINQNLADWYGFSSPYAVQSTSGFTTVGGCSLVTQPGIPVWLAAHPEVNWIQAAFPTDEPGFLRLATPLGTIECDRFSAGRIAVDYRDPQQVQVYVYALAGIASIRCCGFPENRRMWLNGVEAE